MDSIADVSVRWDKKRRCLQIQQDPLTLTDAIHTVVWSFVGLHKRGIPEIRFSAPLPASGPFLALSMSDGKVYGSGNRGTGLPPENCPYEVVIRGRLGTKALRCNGLLINEAAGGGHGGTFDPPGGPPCPPP